MDELETPTAELRSEPEVVDVVATLLRSSSDTLRVAELSPQFATLVAAGGSLIRVLRLPVGNAAVRELIERCLDLNPPKGSEVILVGGQAKFQNAIEQSLPRAPRHPIVVYHLPEDAPVSGFPEKRAKSELLELLSETRILAAEEIETLLARAQEDHRTQQGEAREKAEFFGKMGARKPRVTFGILACIALAFGLQNLKGFDLETTYALGALHGDTVRAGEWWRLISSGYLHGGFMHVAMNGFVLYLLGGQLERVIGGYRFLILYLAALLGGSFLSMQFAAPETISVGASGAIWGLLGAQLSLALGRPPIVPRSVAQAMKPLAKQNLILNFFISFVPGIDWAAHFGGGLAGGLLLASGLLHRDTNDDGEAGAGTRLVATGSVLVTFVALYQAFLS